MSRFLSALLVSLSAALSDVAFSQVDMNSLISAVHSDPSKRPQLLKLLMSGHVFIIASWESPQSTSITVQDFIRNGHSFIPIFSDSDHFKTETKGSGFETKGISIDANFFASLLTGSELVILNPGSQTPIELHGAELKQLVDPSRLPKVIPNKALQPTAQPQPQPQPQPQEEGTKKIGLNHLEVTKPIKLSIWKSKDPVPEEVLKSLQEIAKRVGAKEVYWFPMRLSNGTPHLGLGVAPASEVLFDTIGKEFEPIWRRFSPQNPIFDILPLDSSPTASFIRSNGTLLFRAKQ